MTDVVQEKDEYAAALESAGYLKPETQPEATPAASTAVETPPVAAPEVPPVAETVAAPATPTPAATPVAEAELFPGFKDLSPEAQKAVKQRLNAADAEKKDYEQRWKAQHGQLAPTQRELEQARRTAKQLADRLTEYESRPRGTPPADDVLAKFKERYPDEADALSAVSQHWETQLQALARQNAELRDHVQGVTGTVQRQQEVSQLSQRHPDWQSIDSSDTFKAWLGAAGPHKQALARSNSANDVAELMDDYKRDFTLAQMLNTPAQVATPTPSPTTAKPKPRDADPNPTQRQSAPLASNAGTSEADDYVATLRANGYEV